MVDIPNERFAGDEEEDHEVECPSCRRTVIVNEGTGIYECADCGEDIEISLVCPKCGEKREVGEWGELNCVACGASFDSWDQAKIKPVPPPLTPWILFKRFLTFLGAITFLFLVLLGAVLVYAFFMMDQLTPSSKIYADDSIRAIITTWSEDEFIKRASPECRAITTQGQLDQLFVTLSKWGKFQSYGGAQGKVDASLNSKKGLIFTAAYHATATFQYGKADITITLIRHHHAWQIEGFHADESPFYPR